MRIERIQDVAPEVAVRIPGTWRDPRVFGRALPDGYSLGDSCLHMPDGGSLAMYAHPPDREFPCIFASACRGQMTAREQRRVRRYAVNICLVGTGGSVEAAQRMMSAAAAVVRAGGLGVFVDNSGTAHLGREWLRLAGDPDAAATFPAFVASYASKDRLYSVGMHVLGLRDAILPRTGDREADACVLSSFLLYTICAGEVVGDGEYIGDEEAPTHQVRSHECTFPPAGTPMHNPYGCWRLEVLGEGID